MSEVAKRCALRKSSWAGELHGGQCGEPAAVLAGVFSSFFLVEGRVWMFLPESYPPIPSPTPPPRPTAPQLVSWEKPLLLIVAEGRKECLSSLQTEFSAHIDFFTHGWSWLTVDFEWGSHGRTTPLLAIQLNFNGQPCSQNHWSGESREEIGRHTLFKFPCN